MPHPGELKETITIKQAVESQSGTGSTVVDWANATVIRTARAKVEPLRGSEQQAAGIGEKATAEYRIWIHWSPAAITTEMRIFWRSRELDIVSGQNLRYENEWIEILAREHRAT